MRHFDIARKTASILANLSLLLNSFLPFVLTIQPVRAQSAEEISPTPIVESTPTPEVTPIVEVSPQATPSVDPTPQITPEVSPVAEVTPSITPIENPSVLITPEPENNSPSDNQPEVLGSNSSNPTVTEVPTQTPTPTPINNVEQICLTETDTIRNSVELDWNYNQTEDFYETREKVQLGVKYIFPQENNVTVTFTCLPKDEILRTNLKIKKFKTSDLKLPDQSNVGEYAYDITTGMFDGQFKYDITLPKSSDSAAEVSYIEKTLDQAKENISTDEIKSIENLEQQTDSVKATNVDHFTIFIVSDGGDRSDTSFQQFASSDLNKIKSSDNSRLESDGNWHKTDYQNDRYIQFEFDPDLSDTATITSPVNLIFEYQRDALGVDSYYDDYKARILILNQNTNNWDVLASNVRIEDPSLDQTFNIVIPTQYVNTINKLNNLKIRFQTVGRKALTTNGIKTYHDYVALDFSFSDVHKMNICHNTSSSTNPWNAINIDTSAWSAHQIHHDFIYNGPTKPNGHPDNKNGQADTWCNNNIPSYCGDGHLDLGELCDDGNDVNTDTCTNICTIATCGDGIKSSTEQCDDGNSVDNDTCTNLCTLPVCGDGILNQLSETCDDGNTVSGDGCNSSCTVEPGIIQIKKVIPTGGTNYSDFSFSINKNSPIDFENDGTNEFVADIGTTYTITETPNLNYQVSYNGCTDISVTAGQTKICTITNSKLSTLTIIKNAHPDNSQDFQFNGGDLGNFYLDDDDDDTLSNTKTFTVIPGHYSFDETIPVGWEAGDISCQGQGDITNSETHTGGTSFDIGYNSSYTCTFNNYKQGSIEGYKYNDANNNGSFDVSSEKGISDWTIYLYEDLMTDGDADPIPFKTITSDSAGKYRFENLSPKNYYVCEGSKENWVQTQPSTGSTVNGLYCYQLDLSQGQDLINNNFGNYQKGKITVYKFNDLNGNGTHDEGESYLSNWQINIDKTETEKY